MEVWGMCFLFDSNLFYGKAVNFSERETFMEYDGIFNILHFQPVFMLKMTAF
jgi:hypothetical protein